MNQPLLKGIQVGTEVARGSRVYQPAAGDDADLVAQAADLMGIVAAEKCRDILLGRKAPEKAPHRALRKQSHDESQVTRLTNGFSKKIENHAASVALGYFAYNFIKIHRTLRTSPAMAAGVTDRLWDVSDLVALWEAEERRLKRAA